MNRTSEQKIVMVTQKTRLENLIRRYNTPGQAKFYIEHNGGDFDDYVLEDSRYRAAVDRAADYLDTFGRLHVVDREFIPNYMFGERDIVVAVGRDGLVANTLKYLTTQKLIGVNPDPRRWDGVLLPFSAEDLPAVIPEAAEGRRRVRSITFAQARLSDGQCLIGVNDIFIGQRTHTSARYELDLGGVRERQSSSGIIVSTGLGSTGWLKSIIAGARGIGAYCRMHEQPTIDRDFCWESRYLYYTVREPYPSASTGAGMVFGKIIEGQTLRISSQMPENGVIFSDGMEQDYIEFNSGAIAEISICKNSGNLVV